MKESINEISIKTQFGIFNLTATPKGLSRLDFPRNQKTGFKKTRRSNAIPVLAKAGKHLEDYLKGEPISFNKLQLDLSGFTPFEQKVLKALSRVKYGCTQSYKDLARTVGSPGAARAVGSVMRKNRLPIILPCHRIVGAQGKLGGYSLGLEWKKHLLEMETKGRQKT